MFTHLRLFALLALPCVAQELHTVAQVKGTVSSDESLAGNHLTVSLTDAMSHMMTARSYVSGDGGFEFRNVPAGTYNVELKAQNGDAILSETRSIGGSGEPIELRLPTPDNKPGGATGTVSVRQLQHPLTSKSKKMFAEADKASAKGEYLRAVDILRGTLNDAAAVPYAHMNIGVAYMRAGQAPSAIPELQAAVEGIPEDAVARTNLAYALLLTGHLGAAENEARRALALDRNNAKTRWIMGSILLSKGGQVEEGVENLRLASREIPKARMMLAQYYERTGQKDAATKELREFLAQASPEDRPNVEKWIGKLASK